MGQAHLAHGVEDTALHRLLAVAHVGQGASLDHRNGVLQIGALGILGDRHFVAIGQGSERCKLLVTARAATRRRHCDFLRLILWWERQVLGCFVDHHAQISPSTSLPWYSSHARRVDASCLPISMLNFSWISAMGPEALTRRARRVSGFSVVS